MNEPPSSQVAADLIVRGELHQAEAICQERLRAISNDAESLHLLGLIAMRRRKPAAAITLLRQAISAAGHEVAPRMIYNLGEAQRLAGDPDGALSSYHAALVLNPAYEQPLTSLALLAIEQGLWQKAHDAAARALAINPASAKAHNLIGLALEGQGRRQGALAAFAAAVRADPHYAIAWGNLGQVLANELRSEEAEACLERAVRGGRATPVNCVRLATSVPAINDSVPQIDERRSLIARRLGQLRAEGVKLDLTTQRAWPMFNLAYHGRNDRDLQSAAAALVAAPAFPLPRARLADPRGRVRLGIVSAHFRDHTIARLNRGMIERLPRELLEVTAVSVGHHQDDMTLRIKAAADHFITVPDNNFPAARSTIREGGFDVLLYTGVGMDEATYTLAFSRLAPVQCNTWGHPSTTGIPTIDYFISADALEESDADAHYTEKLVRLANLAVSYDRPDAPPPAEPQAFGLPSNRTLYGCLQTLYKFHPDFDAVMGEILRRDPRGVLVLIDTHPQLDWRARLERRFARTLPDVRDRVQFLPLLDRASYLRLVATVNVLLDPLHFGGGNTSYEAFAAGTPLVTLPSRFLRGRITSALYATMGFDDLIATTSEDYVRLAVELGTDPDRRMACQKQILSLNQPLFDNAKGAQQLGEFLISGVRATSGA